ncbi:MAG: hydantoinase B/oxoprolinase family protein, partial [Caulobacteraceae bacterium]|nr:hydantoinase B/oxoprolinase family protein [Caulobacteraceae bacterium]
MTTSEPYARWTFWIDRGGTFTDVIGARGGIVERSLKLLSVSDAYPDAAVEAMKRILGLKAHEIFPADRVEAIKMGTTVATNALLERKGARTLLIATQGFADALIIGDQTRPDLFALDIVRPEPLAERTIEAAERLTATGEVLIPLDREALAIQCRDAVAAGLTSVAIAFMHADLNPAHELAAAEIARSAGFAHVAMSHEVSPLPRYLPRAETTVADAYLTPALRAYVDQVASAVNGTDLYFMTSAGGLVRAQAFRGKDAVVSGPAGGVVGVAQTALQSSGGKPALGFDMGGTSTDVCRFDGVLERRDRAEVAGVRLRAPMLDVETVAAGGGSILTFDGARVRVGPGSAGAMPGPAAYGRGGPATVTDAQIVLGRLDPAHFPAVFGPNQDRPLDAAAARARLQALAEEMQAPSIEAAAEGFIAVCVEQTAQAVRRISTERGFDPRDHSLVAFGGAAGQIACWGAESLGISEVLSPRHASLLSAWGIGQAQLSSLKEQGLDAPLTNDGLSVAKARLTLLEAEAISALEAQGGALGRTTLRLRLRYDGADAVLPAPLGDLASIRATFEDAHQRLFGFIEPDRPILIASVEVEALQRDERSLKTDSGSVGIAPSPALTGGIHQAETLTSRITGPALIIRGDTQIAVAEGWQAHREADGLIRLIHLGQQSRADEAPETRPNPVTLELFNRRFMGVAEAMGAALERTAHSVNIKERLDFSCALFDAEGGLVANAPHMPVHLGSMGASVRAVRDRHPVLAPGDGFALNNPYAGGTHLPDITVVMPVFLSPEDNQATFYVAARGHHADVGGIQPGSMPPFSKTIDEEGVMLDALPIMRAGQFLEADTRAALGEGRWPARAPDRNIADLKAQIAACLAGASAVRAMIEAHGGAKVARYMGFVQDNAADCVRKAIGKLSNGQARVPMDGGAEIVVTSTVDAVAGRAVLDFSDTSAVLGSNFNAPTAIVHAAALYVFRTLVDDQIPLNAGCLKPLEIRVPEGSLLAPTFPAAVVAGNVETSQHVVDALYAALGVLANSQGSMNNFTFGDETRQYYETLCGGAGASHRADGANAVHSHMTNSRLTDPEILERRFPVRVETFAVRKGSGGTGRFKGGDGAVRRIRFLAPMEAALLS